MNSNGLVDAIAKRAGVTKIDARSVLNAITGEITDTVKKGGKIMLGGFGVFEKSARVARKGRNPQTGEEIQIKAVKIPKFRAGKKFKDAVNNYKVPKARKAKKR